MLEVTDFCRKCGATVLWLPMPIFGGFCWWHEIQSKIPHEPIAPLPDEAFS